MPGKKDHSYIQHKSEPSLPKGWQWVRLGDICEESTGTTDPAKTPDKYFKYIDISSIDNKSKRIIEPKNILGIEAPSRARQLVRTNDILVSTTRPNLNAVAVVPPELDVEVCSTGFSVLRSKADIESLYLFAYVQTPIFVNSLSDLVKGALYPAVTDKQVRNQFIPLPPLSEQKRIAGILNEQMGAVEKAREAAKTQLEAAKALTSAYLRAVFDSPEALKWPVKKMGEFIINCRNGIYKPDEYYGRGIPILKMYNIGRLDGSWNLDRIDQIELTQDEANAYKLQEGDILINRVNSRELVGKCALVNAKIAGAVYESKNIRLRLNHQRLLPEYAAIYLNSISGRKQIEEKLKQIVGQATINQPDLENMGIPVPPAPKQQQITTILNRQMAAVDRTRMQMGEQTDAVNKLPAALLRQAFEGKL